jgi:hypothetical protein
LNIGEEDDVSAVRQAADGKAAIRTRRAGRRVAEQCDLRRGPAGPADKNALLVEGRNSIEADEGDLIRRID